MNALESTSSHPGLYPRVDVAHIGPWWTYDAASLRVPARDGHYVSIWSVGSGPSVLLVPPTTDHAFWVPTLADLECAYTLHAMDRRDEPPNGSPELRREAEARDLRLAAWAIGAVAIVACSDTVKLLHVVSRGSTTLKAVVLCRVPGPDEADVIDGLGVPAISIEASHEAVALGLGRPIRSALDRLLSPLAVGEERE